MRISDWSSDVCSSDLGSVRGLIQARHVENARKLVSPMLATIAGGVNRAAAPDVQVRIAGSIRPGEHGRRTDAAGQATLLLPGANLCPTSNSTICWVARRRGLVRPRKLHRDRKSTRLNSSH